MPEKTGGDAVGQEVVNRHFQQNADYWNDIYYQDGVYAEIHRERSASVLRLVDALGLAPGARILEVGCGAGLTTTALAKRGHIMEAIDSVPAMIELTRRKVEQQGLSDRVHAGVGDCHCLGYPENSFEVVIAMGVTPYLHSLPVALRELARVLKPGGHIVINADNRWRLNTILHPLHSPLLVPFRHIAEGVLRSFIPRDAKQAKFASRMYSRGEFDFALARAGFSVLHSFTLGFGPFSFLGKKLPERLGMKVHRSLQALSDRGVIAVSSTGSQYIVLGKKNPSQA
ncbi:MAG: class I SAM-dependent methyltransferase [Terriglobales bacterium]